MNRENPVIAVVIPCYNEAEALPISSKEILAIIDEMATEGLVSPHSFILCSNDGSRDGTWDLIKSLNGADRRVKGISLAHNRGHQYALLAGLMWVRGRCDAAISIDADLQDDPRAMIEMVRKFRDGDDIVYGVRSSRKTDTWFKRSTAHGFYSFQKAMGLDTVYDHADYRLMDAKALDMLSEYGESNLFLRGIVPQIGLKTGIVAYERNPRVAGESKYPLSKMLSFSIDGITSFSSKPIRMIFFTGLIFLLIDVCVLAYVLYSFFEGHVVPGWSSLMLSIWFVGGIILMSLGIVGEYIGKIFVEVKGRPRYSIAEEVE